MGLFRRYENNNLPINKLPVEIISRIFRFAVAPNPDVLGDPSEQVYLAITIAEVCSRWRTIALEDPSLWYHIVDSNRIQPIDPRLILERSGTSTLHVHTVVPHEKAGAIPHHVLETFPERVQALHLTIPIQSADVLNTLKRLPPLLALDLLTIRAPDQGNGDGRIEEVSPQWPLLFSGETPKLCALHLGPGIQFIPGNRFPVLAHLRLTRLPKPTLTVDKLVRLLSNCPQLVTLQVDGSPIEPASAEFTANMKLISLPLMQALWINLARVAPVFAIIACLEFPSNVNIRLSNLIASRGDYNDHTFGNAQPPVLITPLPALRNIEGLTHLDVLEWLPYGELEENNPLYTRPVNFHFIARGPQAALWIHFATGHYGPRSAVARILPDLYALLPTEDLTSLQVSVVDPSHIAHVASLLEGAPRLRTFALRGKYSRRDGETQEGLDVLARTLTPTPPIQDSEVARVPAPMLESLSIDMQDVSITSSEACVRMVEQRALCGHPLRSISLVIPVPSPKEDGEDEMPAPLRTGLKGDVEHDPEALWKLWRSQGIAPTFTNVKNDYWRLWTGWGRHSFHGLPTESNSQSYM